MINTLRVPTLLIASLTAAGCSGVRGTRTAFSPQIQTFASVGDKPLPVVSGPPGESVVATQSDPPRQTRDESRVSGRVVDAQGRPVANAKVRVAIGSASGGKVARTSTDDSGAFTLHGLRPGSAYTLIAETEDDQGLITGRSSVEAPDNQVKIRLRDLEDQPEPASSTRVSSISSRRSSMPDEEADGPVERSRRVNEEDLPPEPEAEAISSRAEPLASQRDRRSLPQLAAPVEGSQWHRGTGTPTNTPGALSDPQTSRSSAASEESDAQSTVDRSEPDSSPALPDPAHTQTRQNPDAIPIDQDIPNPLPPAIEQPVPKATATSSTMEPNEPGPAQPELVSNEPTPEAQPKPIPSPVAEAPQPTEDHLAIAESPAEAAPIAEPESTLSATSSTETPSLPFPEVEDTGTAPAFDTEAPVMPPDPGSEPQAAISRDTRLSATSTIGPTDDQAHVSGTSVAKRPKWGEVMLQHPEVARADPLPMAPAAGPVAKAPQATPIRGRSASKPRADDGKAFCRYDPKRRQLVDFRLPDLDGKPVRFQDLNADFVLIDFWGTWCSYCVQSIPHLVDLQKQLGPDRLKVVGVAYEEGPPAERAAIVSETAKKLGINYTLLLGGLDGSCPLQDQLHVQSYPTMVLLDRYGRVLWRDTGATPTTLARLDRVLASAANGEVVRR